MTNQILWSKIERHRVFSILIKFSKKNVFCFSPKMGICRMVSEFLAKRAKKEVFVGKKSQFVTQQTLWLQIERYRVFSILIKFSKTNSFSIFHPKWPFVGWFLNFWSKRAKKKGYFFEKKLNVWPSKSFDQKSNATGFLAFW